MNDLRDILAERIAQKARTYASPHIPSRQLEQGMVVMRFGTGHFKVTIPHFWANIMHDGRREVRVPGRTLIWFKDRMDDPRLNGGKTPERVSQLARLTRDGMRKWSKKNYEAVKAFKKARGIKGKIPASEWRNIDRPMIIAKKSKGVPPKPFFSNKGGMAGFEDVAEEIMDKEVPAWIVGKFKEAGLWNVKRKVTIPLRV